MKAKYEFFNCDSEWIEAVIDTENLENDSGEDWTEEMFRNYILETAEGNIRNIEIT